MIKTKNTSQLTETRLKNLERQIEEKHTEIYEKEMKFARNYGRENRPRPDEAISPFVRPILEVYALLFQKVNKELQNLLREIDTEAEIAKSAFSQLSGQKAEVMRKINIRKSALEDLETKYPWKLLPLLFIFAGIILVSEIFLNAFGFSIFGNSLLFSMLISLGVSMAIVIIFHLFIKTIAYAKTLLHKVLIYTAWVIAITVFFYYVGLFRELYLKSNGFQDNIPILGFIIFNWFLLLGAAYILSKCPTWEEITKKYHHIQHSRELRKFKKSLFEIENELNEVGMKMEILKRDKEHIASKDTVMERWIVGMMRKTLADWRSENIGTRTDGFSDLNTIDQNDFLNTNNLKTQLQ
ncbi:MAG: hypothetical protein POELPBGB_02957 [Bacteroidia bacterium]|nr:hypothetical protein [Bacteroidia bacterium]